MPKMGDQHLFARALAVDVFLCAGAPMMRAYYGEFAVAGAVTAAATHQPLFSDAHRTPLAAALRSAHLPLEMGKQSLFTW